MKLFIHPLFIVFLAFSFVSGYWSIALALILAVLIHEFSHAVVASYYGIQTKQLSLLPFGAQVEIDATFLPTKERVIILLAGAFGNMIFALGISALIWMFPIFFLAWETLIFANAITAIINLLPIYPFDGGKILMEFAKKKSILIIKVISSVIFISLMIYGIVIFSPMTILLGSMMLVMIHVEFRSTKFFSPIRTKKTGKICEVAISLQTTLLQAYKRVNRRHFTKFIITDLNNKTFFENDLEQLILRNNLYTNIGKAINDLDV